MRVLLCSLFQPDFVDGASVSARALAQHLGNVGVDVTMWTTDLGWRREQLAQPPATAFGLEVFHAWCGHSLEIAPASAWRLLRRGAAFDLVHFRGLFSVMTCLGALAARLIGRPYVISPLGNWPPPWGEHRAVTRGFAKAAFFQCFCRLALAGADAIVCASDAECDHVRQAFPAARILSIPNGVEPAAGPPLSRERLCTRLGVPTDSELFLFLGRLSPEKGLDFLLRAWNATARRRPRARLVLAGDAALNPAHQRSVQDALASSERPGSLLVTGAVSGAFKQALLAHSCCLLFPSYRESFGNVVLESLAAGTPVVASVGTPWGVLERDDLGRWLAWDETAWSDAMSAFAERSAASREQFVKRSRQWVRVHYSWPAAAARYALAYNEILDPHGTERDSSVLQKARGAHS